MSSRYYATVFLFPRPIVPCASSLRLPYLQCALLYSSMPHRCYLPPTHSVTFGASHSIHHLMPGSSGCYAVPVYSTPTHLAMLLYSVEIVLTFCFNRQLNRCAYTLALQCVWECYYSLILVAATLSSESLYPILPSLPSCGISAYDAYLEPIVSSRSVAFDFLFLCTFVDERGWICGLRH